MPMRDSRRKAQGLARTKPWTPETLNQHKVTAASMRPALMAKQWRPIDSAL
jgi:hypothetical protein